MNIAAILRDQAAAHPATPAILDTWRGRPRAVTYADLERAAAQAAALLWESGLRPGDPVLVFQPMSAELYIALIALFRLGLVPMFIDPSAGRAHIAECCAISPPQAFIGSAKAHLLRLLVPALRRIPRQFVIGPPVPGAIPWRRAARFPPDARIVACDAQTPALITFTSGSTGAPKAAVRTHGLLLAQYRALEHHFGGAPGDVSLATLPIFVLADLASGATSLIPPGELRHPGRIAPAPVLAQIAASRPTRAGGSPAFWERLARYCAAYGLTLPLLQHIYVGGAPVFPRLLDALQALAPDAAIVAVYGSTEAEPIAHIARHELRDGDIPTMLSGGGLLAGPPVPEVQLRVMRDQWGTPVGPYTTAAFAAECLPPDTPGEIVVSGAHVLPGYLGGRGDAETKFRVDGAIWHRTGDAGYLDAAGRLWLLGRCAARIADGRGTLYPFAVECAISADPTVQRAALIARGGQRVLVIEPRDHARPTDLTALERLVGWARLDAIQPVRHIPVDRRHNAKIDYPALYRMLDHQATRGGTPS
jgi:acyl-CoA synthetase (AMP-forming)/AMP-acid ligase II